MSSFEVFPENWNPMADHFSSQNFNSYSTEQSQSNTDPCSLYVKSVPAALTTEAFQSLFSEYGQVIRLKLYPPRENMKVTCGLIRYDNPSEAQKAIDQLNRRPPHNLDISYAKQNTQSSTDANRSGPRNDRNQVHNVSKGRGQKIQNGTDQDTLTQHTSIDTNKNVPRNDNQMNKFPIGRGQRIQLALSQGTANSLNSSESYASSIRKDEPPINSAPKPFGKGRGQPIHAEKFPPIKINFDGNKRVATIYEPNENSLLPKLIPNPNFQCVVCKKPGENSCGVCKKPYCSSACQENDWQHHKSVCKPISGKENQCKYDTGYMSECSNSDKENGTNNTQQQNQINCETARNNTRYPQSSVPNSSSQQNRTSPSKFQEPLTNIKWHEIESSTLPQNGAEQVYVGYFHSPLKLWVQLKSSKATLNEIEKMLMESVEKKSVNCSPNDVCCTIDNGVFCRIKILEVHNNSVTAELFDYGKSKSVKSDHVYHLPLMFKRYPSQAICCKLVDACENLRWAKEDFATLRQYTLENEWLAKIFNKCTDNIYEISLCNADGLDWHTFAQSVFKPVGPVIEHKGGLVHEVPSVLTNLKIGDEVNFALVESSNDELWGVLDDGSGNFPKCLKEINEFLQNIADSQDMAVSCKEGDLAVCFSNSFQEYYRCVVLKKLRNSFLVLYLDFGNKEEVTKLLSAPPALLKKHSYVVCCSKPNSLSSEECEKIFEKPVKMSVKGVTNSSVELTIDSCRMSLQCFPWSHAIPNKQLKPALNTNCQGNKDLNSRVSPTKLPSSAYEVKNNEIKKIQGSPILPTTEVNIPNDSDKTFINSISEKHLTVGSKYNVLILGLKGASELHVQLNEDQQQINAFCQQLNHYCKSDTNARYKPGKDEVVCCKYSEDNNWYRAHVVSKLPENRFKVNFIDFGNAEIVPDVSMKALPKKFACGKFCVYVSLSNVADEDLNDNFIPKLLQNPWIMEVKEASKPLKVMLYQGQKSLVELMDADSKFLKRSLKFQKLPTNETSEVTICFAHDEKLYFNQVKDLSAIKDLQNRINVGDRKALCNKPEIDNVYCCLDEDGVWYRAYVKSEISNNTYKVCFIDFGNEEKVMLNNFKVIPKDVFALPVYCIAAVCENIDKVSISPDTKYTVEVIGENAGVQKVKFFNLPEIMQNPSLESLTKSTLQVGINEVVFCHSENGVYYCQLNKDINNLAAMFEKLQSIQLKPLGKVPKFADVVCAKCSDGKWYRAAIEAIDTINYKVFFIDYGNTEFVSTDKVMILPEEFHKLPILCIPLRIKNRDEVEIDFTSKVSIKGAGFAADGIQFAEIVSLGLALPNIGSLKRQLLPLDIEVDVTFCHVENDVYYAHMVASLEKISALEVQLKDAATFKGLLCAPVEGNVVCARFTDGIWYRGCVKKVCADKTCEILFIDYGNSEVIAMEDLKMPPSEICTFPVFAVPIKISNTEELQKQLQENLSVFKVNVKNSSGSEQLVELVVPGSDLCSIATQVLPTCFTEVTVSHREGEMVYVQKISDLESLQDMIKCFLQTSESLQKIVAPKVGQLYCVKFEDGFLYRGLIKEKCGEDFKAFFVDYGNTSVVKEIYSLPSKFSSLPMLSIPVSISNEKTLACPVNVDSVCKVKSIGKTADNIQMVKVYAPIKAVLFPTMKTFPLGKGSFEVTFHSFDGKFYYLTKTHDNSKVDELKILLRNVSEDEIYHVPSVDEVLLVKCDDSWYRGCIKAINETLKECELFLIDVGTNKRVPYSAISYIPENISSFPIYLIKVSLHSNPFNGTISFGTSYTVTTLNNNSPIPVVQVLQRRMLATLKRKSLPLNQQLNAMFIHKENDILFLQDINDAVPITEVLAEAKKCASTEVVSHIPVTGELLCGQSSADGEWYRCCIEEIVGSDKFKIHFIDYGNSEVVSKGNLRHLTNELMQYPSFGIAVKIEDKLPVNLHELYSVIATNEPVNNVQSVKLVVNQKSSDEIKINTELAKETESRPDISCAGQSEKFLYSSCPTISFSPGEQDIAIYSIPETENKLFCSPFNPENIAANLGLPDEITEYCENLDCSSYNGISLPEEGELVLAKFDEDKKWYRAVVVDIQDSLYEVIFIDFGNGVMLGLDSLRKMDRKFMALPIQANLCSVIGFKVKDDDFSPIYEELKNFIIFVKPEPLKAIISFEDGDMCVEIPEITKYLVEKNVVAIDQ